MKAELAWAVGAVLGEGPVWFDDALWFVDIRRGNLHRLTPSTGAQETFHLGGAPSFVAPLAGGGQIVGSRRELVRVVNGRPAGVIATIDMREGNRTNDATVDPEGRLWFGTMDDDAQQPSGRIYRFDGALAEMGGACTITNGPAVSADGRALYHVDTLGRTIWRFPIESGSLGRADFFARIDPKDGHPDGVTMDAEGCVWVGLWGGWSARRYAPDGALMSTLQLPCANVTKVAFGGAGGKTGYVTTARDGQTEAELAGQPLAGSLFAFEAPAPGLPSYAVRP